MIVNVSAKSVFLLYLLISANFLSQLFPCRTQFDVTQNMSLRHVLGFFTMYVFIVLADSENTLPKDPTKRLQLTVVMYVWFLLSTKLSRDFWRIFIAILAAVFIIQLYKEHEETSIENKQKMHEIQKWLLSIAVVVTIVGVVVYVGQKKLEYGKDFTYQKFMSGKVMCSNTHMDNVPTIELIKKAFSPVTTLNKP
jgi:hypothetical protein